MQAPEEQSLKERIEALAKEYVAIPTHTNTAMENNLKPFFRKWFNETPYFAAHPECCGFFQIPEDHLKRSVAWALVKGTGPRTVVLVHHGDTADILDFGHLREHAYDVAAMTETLREQVAAGKLEVSPEQSADILSGQWLFGRGLCDMKAGGAIEMALMEKYAVDPTFSGNLLLLSLPDEENLSAGMRGAIPLLQALKERHGLAYSLLINTEPHDRETPETGTLYQGSVGKLMPLIYVKGKAAHVGQAFNGFNPNLLLSEIVRKTEMNPAFMETVGKESTLPPVWLYMKDRKAVYDVSLPLAAAGYMSILTFERTPEAYLALLKKTALEAFEAVIASMNACLAAYSGNVGVPFRELPWVPEGLLFDELVQRADARSGEAFRQAYQEQIEALKRQIAGNTLDMAEASCQMIELALSHAGVTEPLTVIALSPPYYPSVNNDMAPLCAVLQDYGMSRWSQPYGVRDYFFGISDLSYALSHADDAALAHTQNNMPLWGEIYQIPLEAIRELSIPVINIGPWGKDFHKLTERVYAQDLYERTPALVEEAIRWAIAGQPEA